MKRTPRVPGAARVLAVGIPARNEAGRIERCIESIVRAIELVDIPVVVAVCADSCTDGTAQIARSALHSSGAARFVVKSAFLGSAGSSRDRACRQAVGVAADVADAGPSKIWVATTDADSVVGADWLLRHYQHAARGLDGAAGLVALPQDTDRRVVHCYRAIMDERGTGAGHGHVHGANLGVRADRLLEAGGFPAIAVGEEQALWDAMRRHGARLAGVTDLEVVTSARLRGRTPAGFARFMQLIDRSVGDRTVGEVAHREPGGQVLA